MLTTSEGQLMLFISQKPYLTGTLYSHHWQPELLSHFFSLWMAKHAYGLGVGVGVGVGGAGGVGRAGGVGGDGPDPPITGYDAWAAMPHWPAPDAVLTILMYPASPQVAPQEFFTFQ